MEFKFKLSLKNHIKKIHEGIEDHKCSKCGMTFANELNLNVFHRCKGSKNDENSVENLGK